MNILGNGHSLLQRSDPLMMDTRNDYTIVLMLTRAEPYKPFNDKINKSDRLPPALDTYGAHFSLDVFKL